jgi:hypothetical protein
VRQQAPELKLVVWVVRVDSGLKRDAPQRVRVVRSACDAVIGGEQTVGRIRPRPRPPTAGCGDGRSATQMGRAGDPRGQSMFLHAFAPTGGAGGSPRHHRPRRTTRAMTASSLGQHRGPSPQPRPSQNKNAETNGSHAEMNASGQQVRCRGCTTAEGQGEWKGDSPNPCRSVEIVCRRGVLARATGVSSGNCRTDSEGRTGDRPDVPGCPPIVQAATRGRAAAMAA